MLKRGVIRRLIHDEHLFWFGIIIRSSGNLTRKGSTDVFQFALDDSSLGFQDLSLKRGMWHIRIITKKCLRWNASINGCWWRFRVRTILIHSWFGAQHHALLISHLLTGSSTIARSSELALEHAKTVLDTSGIIIIFLTILLIIKIPGFLQ